MALSVIASIIAYITTEIDDLVVLLILFSKTRTSVEKASIITGKYIGLALISCCCAVFASYLSKMNTALIGLLGVVPIFMGIKYAVDSIKGKREEQDLSSHFGIGSFLLMSFEVILITLASSGDNIAVYISFFTSVHGTEYIIVAVVFAVLQGLFCLAAMAIMNEKSIKRYVDESAKILIPLLFIALGIYIMVKDGTILWILGK